MMGEAESAKQLGLALNVNQVKEYAESQGLVFDELSKAEKMQITFNLAVTQSKNAIGDAERSAGSYTNRMKALKDRLSDVTKEFGMKLLPAATNFVNLLLDKGVPAFEKFLQVVSDNWTKMRETVTSSIANVLRGIADFLRGLDAFLQSNNTILSKIKDNFVKTWEDIKAITSGLWKFIKEVWEENGDDIGRIALKAFNLLTEIIQKAVSGIRKFFESELGQKMLDDWKVKFDRTLKKIEETIDLFLNLLEGDFKGAFDNIVNLFNLFREEIVTNIKRWWSFLKPPIDFVVWSIYGSFHGLIHSFKQLGEFIIQGLVNGIQSQAKRAQEAITGVAENVYNSIKGFFDIRSPSRVMYQIGGFIAYGMANGIENGGQTVIVKTANMLDELADTIEGRGTEKKAKSAGEAIAEAFGGGLGKGFKEVIKQGQKFVEDNEKTLNGLLDAAGNIANQIGGELGHAFEVAQGVGTGAMQALSGDWFGLANTVISNAPRIAKTIAGVFGGVSKGHRVTADAAIRAWDNAYNSIRGLTKQFTQDFGNVFIGSIKTTIATFEKESRSGLSKWLFGSKKTLDEYARTAVSMLTYISEQTASKFAEIDDSSRSTFQKLADTAKTAMSSAGDTIRLTFSNLQGTLTNDLTKIKAKLSETGVGIEKAFQRAQDKSSQVWRKVVSDVDKAVREIEPLLQQIRGEAVSDAEKLGQATVSALEKKYEAEKEAAIQSIETEKEKNIALINEQRKALDTEDEFARQQFEKRLESAESSAAKELEIVEKTFSERLKTENLKWEAIVLGEEQNQQELIDLLHTYEPRWEHAGKSLGESLVLGMNAVASSNPTKAVLDTLLQIKEYRELEKELEQVEKQVEEAQKKQLQREVSPIIEPVNTTNTTTQTVIINSPVPVDGAEAARQLKNASQQLALGI